MKVASGSHVPAKKRLKVDHRRYPYNWCTGLRNTQHHRFVLKRLRRLCPVSASITILGHWSDDDYVE